MRFVGELQSQTDEGINVINWQNKKVYVEHGDYSKKVFIAAMVDYHEEQIFVVNIPRSRHNEPQCLAAKQKELRDYENYGVFDIVDSDKDNQTNIISTEWVLVEKERMDGSKVVKARLCLRGDQEDALHKIP